MMDCGPDCHHRIHDDLSDEARELLTKQFADLRARWDRINRLAELRLRAPRIRARDHSAF
jgi:hypothetical protein